MLSRSIVVAITGYQRYVSPYKGFCCAYRVKHNDMSCSAFVQQAVLHHGVWRAIPVVKQRFKACKTAAFELNTQPHQRNREQNRGRQQARNNCDACNFIELIPSEGCSALGDADACSCTPW